MRLPGSVNKLIESFEKLPGIGPKTAARLTFYLLNFPQHLLEEFGGAFINLKKQTVICSFCFNIAETDPCPICSDVNRDKSIICVVEQPLDVLALEKSGKYKGVYHVLGGVIDPLNGIGPDEIRIKQLLARLNGSVTEVVLATDPDMEGEATAMYVAKEIRQLKHRAVGKAFGDARQTSNLKQLKITRLGQGLPTGADIEYADETTLERAMEGRREYQ